MRETFHPVYNHTNVEIVLSRAMLVMLQVVGENCYIAMEEHLIRMMGSAMSAFPVGWSKKAEVAIKVFMKSMLSNKKFADLDRSNQGIGEVYNIQKTLGLLPELPAKPMKSDEGAKKLRIAGNEAYKANDFIEALSRYSEAICRAETGDEMALAYTNRSAVTFQLQEYQNSINDVDRALFTGQYPEHFKPKLMERRGKCFLALSQFQKATEDFKQVAILILQSDTNADKVNSLRALIGLIAECQGKKDKALKSPYQPELTHGPSSYIQSASSAVDIKYSREMGRHLVARVDIAPGDILGIEKPYASIITNRDYRWLVCHNCKKRSHSSIPCQSCTEVVFCSHICRETAWEAYHSTECDILHILNGIGCDGPGLIAVRILMKATKLGENLPDFMDEPLNDLDASEKSEKSGFVDGKYRSDDYHAVHHLATNMEHRSQNELLYAAVTASSLVHILKETTSYFDHSDSHIPGASLFKPVSDLRWNHIVAANLLMRYQMIKLCYSYEVTDSKFRLVGDNLMHDKTAIGDAIYPLYSLLNHSCDPNTGFCPYKGDSMIFYATKPITKGQQIFTSYILCYIEQNLSLRQSQLKSRYFFTCQCPACVEDWPQRPNIPEYPQFVSPKAKQIHGAEIEKSFSYLTKVHSGIVKGEMTELDLSFLKKFLTLIHKHLKPPSKAFFVCDHLRIYFYIKFNKNVFD